MREKTVREDLKEEKMSSRVKFDEMRKSFCPMRHQLIFIKKQKMQSIPVHSFFFSFFSSVAKAKLPHRWVRVNAGKQEVTRL